MKIRLLKEHKFHARTLKIGTELEVTKSLATDLIHECIAEEVGREKLPIKKKPIKKAKKENKIVNLDINNEEKTPHTK